MGRVRYDHDDGRGGWFCNGETLVVEKGFGVHFHGKIALAEALNESRSQALVAVREERGGITHRQTACGAPIAVLHDEPFNV